MPFERLLFSPCLLPGVTRFKENETVVEIKAEQGETILFFSIDNNSNSECNLRDDLWGNQSGQAICDLLVFYAKEKRRVLCFVELKDNRDDFKRAVEQVTNTYNAVKRTLKLSNNYNIQAFLIGHHGSVPIKHNQDQISLNSHFGSGNYIYDGKKDEFAGFLRGNPSKSMQRGKKRRR